MQERIDKARVDASGEPLEELARKRAEMEESTRKFKEEAERLEQDFCKTIPDATPEKIPTFTNPPIESSGRADFHAMGNVLWQWGVAGAKEPFTWHQLQKVLGNTTATSAVKALLGDPLWAMWYEAEEPATTSIIPRQVVNLVGMAFHKAAIQAADSQGEMSEAAKRAGDAITAIQEEATKRRKRVVEVV